MRVTAPRRFSQLVRAEQNSVDQAEQAVKEVEQTVSQVMILFLVREAFIAALNPRNVHTY